MTTANPWIQMQDDAAAKWPQTDSKGWTVSDHAADLVERRQVRRTKSGAWEIDGAHVDAEVSQCDCGHGIQDSENGRICRHRVAAWFVRKLERAAARMLAATIREAAGAGIQIRARVTYTGSVDTQRVELLAVRIDRPGERYREIDWPAPLPMALAQDLLYDTGYSVDPTARVVQGRHHAGHETWRLEPMAQPQNPGEARAATRIGSLYGWDEQIAQSHQFEDYARRLDAA